MFVRSEKRRITPWLVLAVGGLATVGAISILSRTKSLLNMGKKKIGGIFSGEREECEYGCD